MTFIPIFYVLLRLRISRLLLRLANEVNTRPVDLYALLSHIVRAARGGGENGQGPSGAGQDDPALRYPVANAVIQPEEEPDTGDDGGENVGGAEAPQPHPRREYSGFLLLPNTEPGGNGGADVLYFGPPGVHGGRSPFMSSAGENSVPDSAR